MTTSHTIPMTPAMLCARGYPTDATHITITKDIRGAHPKSSNPSRTVEVSTVTVSPDHEAPFAGTWQFADPSPYYRHGRSMHCFIEQGPEQVD